MYVYCHKLIGGGDSVLGVEIHFGLKGPMFEDQRGQNILYFPRIMFNIHQNLEVSSPIPLRN
jgi:hypothetical protein